MKRGLSVLRAPHGVPVNLHVPGCPPHPITFLDGLLRMLGRLGPGDGAPRTAGPG